MNKAVSNKSPMDPVRTCVGCDAKKNKYDLVRIVLLTDGRIIPDATGKTTGRGAYLCADMQCLDTAIKKKRFDRAFRCTIDKNMLTNFKVEYAECLKTRCAR